VLLGIDHLVVAVPDLGTAMTGFTTLGFTVVPGGRHPQGTHNALIAFADGAYLELIAFFEPNPRHRWWDQLQRGGGLIDFCLRTTDLAADLAAFRAAGVEMDDPRPLSRVRPDGVALAWRLGIPRGPWPRIAPFLIEDETPRSERVPAETTHANGATGVASVTVALADPAVARRAWEGVAGARVETGACPDIDAAGIRVTVGPHRFDFVAPRSGAGPLAGWLRARGPSPWAIALHASAPAGWLDVDTAQGARIRLG
jgi:hypothetical protein